MSRPDHHVARQLLASALRAAYDAGLGVPASLQAVVRGYAASLRHADMPVEKAIIEVKSITREAVRERDIIFLPQVVGWAVAGYFEGTATHDDR